MDKDKILITTSVMLSLLGTACVSQIPVRPVMAQSMEMVAANDKVIDKIYETKNWKKMEEKWSEMGKVKVKDFEEVTKVVEEQKKNMADLYEPLIKESYLSTVSAEAINLVYGENLRSVLERTVQLPTCYKPVAPNEWDCRGVDTREGLKKKLDLLEETYKKGSIKKEVYTDVKKDMGNRLALLDKADKYWQSIGEGKCETHPEEVDVILHLYDQNAGGIRAGKEVGRDLFKAAEYIVKLEQGALHP